MTIAPFPAPRLVRVYYCAACGEPIIATRTDTRASVECSVCPVRRGVVRSAVYVDKSASDARRLRAMRRALTKLAKFEHVDPGDAQDILDEDDKRRRRS